MPAGFGLPDERRRSLTHAGDVRTRPESWLMAPRARRSVRQAARGSRRDRRHGAGDERPEDQDLRRRDNLVSSPGLHLRTTLKRSLPLSYSLLEKSRTFGHENATAPRAVGGALASARRKTRRHAHVNDTSDHLCYC